MADEKRKYGVGVPNGEVARSAAEAEKIAKSIGMKIHNNESSAGLDC